MQHYWLLTSQNQVSVTSVGNTTPMQYSPQRERQTEEKWNCIKPPELTTKHQEIQGTGEHVNDTTEIHSTTSRL